MVGFLISVMIKPQLIKRGTGWIQILIIIFYQSPIIRNFSCRSRRRLTKFNIIVKQKDSTSLWSDDVIDDVPISYRICIIACSGRPTCGSRNSNVQTTGTIEKVFNNRLVTPLGRLSFVVYLVNIQVMMVMENRQSSSISPTKEIDGWMVGTFRTYTYRESHVVSLSKEPINKNHIFQQVTELVRDENYEDFTKRRNSKTENSPNNLRCQQQLSIFNYAFCYTCDLSGTHVT
ncbi:hypothetical protein QTP88_005560 [Uroleucon formosanum]